MNKPLNYTFGPVAGRDALFRKLPMPETVGPLRNDRFVGMFYFINLKQNGKYKFGDNTKILKETPEAIWNPDHPAWKPGCFYWGEPLFGYYAHDDEWVIRKHVEMLTLADVDFIVFDTTNYSMHAEVALTVMKIFNEYWQAGWKVPQIVFYTNTQSGIRVQEIYETIYKANKYPDIWFKWEGKPLIIGKPEQCSEEVRDFFTFRLSQWPTEKPKLVNGFPWIDFNRPQLVYKNEKGENEVISVSIAQHPQIKFGDSAFYGEQANRGRSYHQTFHESGNDYSEGAVNWGYNFAEQWEYAISQDPKIIFVTGWNEWVAGVLRRPNCKERPVTFIDTATQEFSRDIEPMKGGHFDNYYMQLISYIRKYKGAPDWPEYSKPKTIDINGDFSQWDDVYPAYRDFPFGSVHRRHIGMDGKEYINETGRNDFDEMKVTHDNENLYFYCRCFNNITNYDFTPWMLMFLRVQSAEGDFDPEDHPSWEGYHFLFNHERLDGEYTFVYECLGGWRWQSVATVRCKVEGKELQAVIPKKVLGLEGKNKFEIQFKWADNIKETETVEDFYLNGDVAPYGRLNFVYRVR